MRVGARPEIYHPRLSEVLSSCPADGGDANPAIKVPTTWRRPARVCTLVAWPPWMPTTTASDATSCAGTLTIPNATSGATGVVAAFDNRREFERQMRMLSRELEHRRAKGQPVDPREHYTSLILEPGDQRRQRAGIEPSRVAVLDSRR